MTELREFLETDQPAARALRRMSELFVRAGGGVLLVGGAARDILLQGGQAEVRDLDFVVSGVDLAKVLADFETTRTGFGAYRFTCEGTAVDAWLLPETLGFKQVGLTEPTLADFVKVTFFNVEAAAIELPSGTVYDGGFRAAIESKILELNVPTSPVPGARLVRAAVLASRYNLRFGPKLEDWILEERPKVTAGQLVKGQKLHETKRMLHMEALLGPLNEACSRAEARRRASGSLQTATNAVETAPLASAEPALASAEPALAASAPMPPGPRLAWTPLAPPLDPGQLSSPFASALAAFWQRVSGVGRELFDDFDARVYVSGRIQPELEATLTGPLNVETIRRVHAIVTRDQAAVPARLVDGTWRHVALAHGQFKERPNEARRRTGLVVEFCPPELVVPELERVLAEYARIPSRYLDVRAAWLLAGVLSVHPFIDGNGRVSRVLGDVDFLRAGLPAPRVSVDTRGAGYIDAVEASFDELEPLVAFLNSEVENSVMQALRNLEQATKLDDYSAVLAERYCVELARARFSAELVELGQRESVWMDTLAEVVAEAPQQLVKGLRLQHGLAAPEVSERIAAHGLRLRCDARAISAKVELVATGWDCTFDLVPAGAVGVGAFWGVASAGLRAQRERIPPLLLVAGEELPSQLQRLRRWVQAALVKATAKSIIYHL